MTGPGTSTGGFVRATVSRLERSLKARMVAVFLAVSVAIAIVTAITVYLQAAAALRKSVEDRLAGLADRRVEDVNSWVKQQSDLLAFTATLPGLADDAVRLQRAPAGEAPDQAGRERARVERLLRAAVASGLAATEVQVLSLRGGRVLAATDAPAVGTYRVQDPFYVQGLKGPFVSEIYPAPETARPVLSISTPLHDASGRVVGVVAAHFNLHAMQELLAQPSPGFPVRVYLVNTLGELVSADRFGSEAFRRGVQSTGITRALQRNNGMGRYRDYEGETVIGAYRWIAKRDLALLVEVPERDALATARTLLLSVLVGGLFAGGLLALVVYLVTGRVAEPILATARAARRIAAGDFTVRAPVTTRDEVGELATSFNEMTDRLGDVYDDLNGQVQATTSALEALRENQALMHGIVDNSATLVLVVSQSGRCVLVNREVEGVFGVRREALQGRMLLDVIPGEAAVSLMEATESVIQRGVVVEREFTASSERGPRTYLAVCFPIAPPGGAASAVGVIATDLTERKRAEAEQREFEANVQHAQKLESLGVMAGGIAHDFNNILGAVLGNADLALNALDDREEVRRSLEQVVSAARRAADLTRQMLAYAGRASFRREPSDINALLRELSGLASMSLSKKAHVDLQLCEPAPWVTADPAQLSQVVLNLLTNAGDAIGDATGQVTVRTEIVSTLPRELADRWMGEPAPGGPYALLIVEDDGAGMDEETQRRMFEPFFTTKELGRGLGLAAVLGIVKGIGGALTVRSARGVGTRITVAFPASVAPASRPASQAAAEAAELTPRTVLVVDDEPMLRSLARRGLRNAGFEVLEAADGHQGLAMFTAGAARIAVVVLDLTMPGMSGSEVLQGIRALDDTVPVVITSGYAPEQLDDEARHETGIRYVQKPYTILQLVRTVSEVARQVA
ncbi:MAG: response regulator [Gemmatimonadetes bacterium]|nr:response regulator [Gemmatimonadota bacterium]